MSDTFDVDVREMLAQRIAQAPPASAWAEVELRATDPNRPTQPPDRRNPAVVWLAIAGAVVLVVGGAVVLLRDDDGSVVIEEGPATTVTEPTDPATVDEGAEDDATVDDNRLDEDDPDVNESGVDEAIEVVDSLFEEEVASAVASDEPATIQAGDWTGVSGLGISQVVSDGDRFYALASRGEENNLLGSDDGTTWDLITPVPFTQIDAARDGTVVAVHDQPGDGDPSAATAYVVYEHDNADDGVVVTSLTQLVPFTVPAQYEPFNPDLGPSIFIRDDGSLLVHAHYRADEYLVLLAAIGVPIEDVIDARDRYHEFTGCFEQNCELLFEGLVADQLGVPVEELRGDVGFGVGAEHVELTLADGVRREFPIVDLGLDTLYTYDKPLAAVAEVGGAWTQIDPGSDVSISEMATIPGGLVGITQPLVFGVPDWGLSVSEDGVVWRPVLDTSTGDRLPESGRLHSRQHRAFYVGDGEVWEITIDGGTPIGGDTFPTELNELFQFPPGELLAGRAGTAFMPSVVRMTDSDPGPSELVTSTDGRTWARETLPDELSAGSKILAVGSSRIVAVQYDHPADPIVWSRDIQN